MKYGIRNKNDLFKVIYRLIETILLPGGNNSPCNRIGDMGPCTQFMR